MSVVLLTEPFSGSTGSGTVTSVDVSGGTTGLTTTGGPVTTSGTITLAGILAVANGGTGTATPALVAGTNVTITGTWPNQTINASGGGGGVTSITFGSTGLTPSTATTGAVTVAGTLAVASGGTGVTTSSGASSVVLRDANSNITTNATFNGFTSVAASGTTITLTAASTPVYFVTGSGGQVIQLPNATTLPLGTIFSFNNNQSSGAITVNNASATLVVSVPSGGYTTVVLTANGTSAGSWDRHDQTPANVSWSTNTLDYAGSITSATWNGATVSVNRGGTGATTLTGILKGNGTSAITAATSGTDYAPATSGSSILYGNNAGGFSNVTVGTGLSFSSGTLTATGAGTVTSVGASAPVASSGGTTPTISLNAGYGDTLNPYASKTANSVLAAPNGVAGVPTFRLLVAADIPSLTYQAPITLTTTGSSGAATFVGNTLNIPVYTGGGSTGPILESQIVISQNYTLSSNANGFSVSPVTVSTGYAVTVPSGQVWAIWNI